LALFAREATGGLLAEVETGGEGEHLRRGREGGREGGEGRREEGRETRGEGKEKWREGGRKGGMTRT
jgi:hypothetical protein